MQICSATKRPPGGVMGSIASIKKDEEEAKSASARGSAAVERNSASVSQQQQEHGYRISAKDLYDSAMTKTKSPSPALYKDNSHTGTDSKCKRNCKHCELKAKRKSTLMLLKASYASLYAVDNNSQEEEEDEISTKGFSTDTTVTVAVLEPSRSQGGQAAPQPRKERLGSLPLPRQSKSVPMSEGIVGWRSSARRATVHPTTFLGGPQATKSSQVPQELKGIQNSRHFPRIGTLLLSSKQEVDKRRFSIPAAIKTLQQPNSNKLKPLTPSPSNSKSFNLFAPTTAKLHERKPPAPVKVTLPGSVVTWSNREQKAAPSVVVLDLDDTTEQPISRNGASSTSISRLYEEVSATDPQYTELLLSQREEEGKDNSDMEEEEMEEEDEEEEGTGHLELLQNIGLKPADENSILLPPSDEETMKIVEEFRATSIHKMSNLTENMKQFFSDMLTDIETTSYYSQQQIEMALSDYTPQKVLIISSNVPKCTLLKAAVKPDVHCQIYNFENESLTGLVETVKFILDRYRAGTKTKYLGIVCKGGPGHMYILAKTPVTPAKLRKNEELVKFWRELGIHMSKLYPWQSVVHLMESNVAGNKQGERLLAELEAVMFTNRVRVRSPLEMAKEGRQMIELYFDPLKHKLWKSTRYTKISLYRK